MTGKAIGTGEDRVAFYKGLLRTYIDRRPSGTRKKIARALGKHKSFVSQITSPAYPVPLPAPHVETVLEICHFSPEERQTFLRAYEAAHPRQIKAAGDEAGRSRARTLHIEVPSFGDPVREKEVADAIRDLAARIIALARTG